MAHFAKLNNNHIVISINVIDNNVIQNLSFPESESVGIEFLKSWNEPDIYWKQTSYNGNFRKNYAGIGYLYDVTKDAFISPKPFNSWVLDESTCKWKPPIEYPNDGKEYIWDESSVSWILKHKD